MSTAEKKAFLNKLTVLYDTREKKNQHILEALEGMGVPFEEQKLDYGDYSFRWDVKDFRQTCVIERKANVDELYGNLTYGRDTFEKEIAAASVLSGSFTLLLENCENEADLKAYRVPDWRMNASPQRKVQDIGRKCYPAIRSWEQRYHFHVRYVPDKERTAAEMLEVFYWYWHGYKKLTAPLRRRT